MQRLHNLDKWKELPEGHTANFENTHARRVRLDVNAPFPVRLYAHDGNGETTFLALVSGRDVIEFAASGEVGVTVEGGGVWLHTVDGENLAFEIPQAESFTKLIERRPRNHELELMNYMMNQNIERRLAAQRDELVALWGRREAAQQPPAAKPSAAGDGAGDNAKPEPAPTDSAAGKSEPANDGSGAKPEPAKAK